jgi:hypothetical protein
MFFADLKAKMPFEIFDIIALTCVLKFKLASKRTPRNLIVEMSSFCPICCRGKTKLGF